MGYTIPEVPNDYHYISRTFKVTIDCPDCHEEFETDWSFGDTVTCTHCGATYETDWDYADGGDTIMGPWLGQKVEE